MTALVTVGSTKFDLLVDFALSRDCLEALREGEYTKLIVQYGNSKWPANVPEGIVSIAAYKFKPTLMDDIRAADLVISHAGSGTILDALRISKPLIVVPNDTLMDNHQSQLADELERGSYVKRCTPYFLADTIRQVGIGDTSLRRFPEQDKTRFRDLLDEEMGFK